MRSGVDRKVTGEAKNLVSLVIGNSLAREGVKRILVDSGFGVVQAVPTIAVLETCDDRSNHVVLVEASGTIDLECDIAELRARFPLSRLAILDDQFRFQVMYRAFEAGASGYILMDSSPYSFVARIRLVLMNEKVAPSKLIDLVMSADKKPFGALLGEPGLAGAGGPDTIAKFHLTDRQQEILDRLVLGQSNKVISRELKISEATVKVGLRTIFRKLSVKNRTQAALLAREKHLMSPQTSAKVIPLRRAEI